MEPEKPTIQDLIAIVRKDCRGQAKQAAMKLNEVIECLENDNHLGAMGAFAALDEDMVCLKVFLTRITRLTGLPPREL